MKNTTKVVISIFALAIASIFTTEYSAPADAHNTSGDPKKTGSPGDGSTCSSCHGTTTTVAGLITSNVPSGGYTPGTKYTVTGTITSAGTTKFGFSMSPQNNAGTLLGTMTITDATNTQLNTTFGGTAGKWFTHKAAGMTGTTGSHSWSVDWTAPAAGTGDVTFYGIFVASNADNTDNSADKCSKSSLLIHEATACTAPTITGTTPGSVCNSGSVTLGATASAGTINWYAASTGGSAITTGPSYTTPSLTTTTTYYVDATNSGCTTASRTAVVATVSATPTITGTTPNSRCDVGSVTLGATSSAGSCKWYAASTGGSVLGIGSSFNTPSISTTTDYYVEANNSGCVSASRTQVTATVNPAPTISSTIPAARCDAGTLVLAATPSAGTCDWYAASTGGSSLGTTTSFTTPSISNTTTYYVDATFNGCTTSTRTAVVATIKGNPTITGTTPGQRCSTGTVNLSATASSGTVDWFTASTGGSSLATTTSFTTPSISSSTPYFAEASDNGCTSVSRTQVMATVNALPTATISGDATVCSGASSVISVALTGASPWALTYGSTAGSNPVTGITSATYTTTVQAGTYTLSAVSDANSCNGISFTGSAAISESTPISVSASTVTCNGGNTAYTVEFNISGGDPLTYNVPSGGTLTGNHFTSNLVPSGTGASFTANDAQNCNPVLVSENKNCNCAANGVMSGGGTICSGNVATVSVALTGIFPWKLVYSLNGVKQPAISNINSSPYSFTTTTTGTYTLDSIYDANCIGSTSGNAMVSQTLPTATLTGGGTICADGSTANLIFALTGASPWSFTYTDGTNSFNSTSSVPNFSIPKSTAGTYAITAISDLTCAGTPSGSATINVNALPTVGVTVTPLAMVCIGNNVTLAGTGAASYSWSGGVINNTAFAPTQTLTYTVTGTDANSCSNKATQTITVNQLPIVGSTASPSANVCQGSNVTLSGTGASSYVWSGGVIDGQPFQANANLTYTVVGTDNVTTCSNKATTTITVTNCSGPAVASVTIDGGSTSICLGTPKTFTATPTNGGSTPGYQWQVNGVDKGTSADTFTPTSLTSGDQVTVTLYSSLPGVTGSPATSNTITVTVNPTPSKPTITRPVPGNQLVSSATTGNVWYLDGLVIVPNETNQQLTLTQFSQTGNYTVIVSENGCTSEMSDSISVQNKATGVGEINNVIFFNVYPNPNDGNFNVSFEVPEKGTYKLELKNLLGQSVYQETLNNFNGVYTDQLRVADYGKGVYTLILTGSKSETIKKVIVY